VTATIVRTPTPAVLLTELAREQVGVGLAGEALQVDILEGEVHGVRPCRARSGEDPGVDHGPRGIMAVRVVNNQNLGDGRLRSRRNGQGPCADLGRRQDRQARPAHRRKTTY
jgi:hypothetical protein